MGHDDDQVAHSFCDQWKALGIGEGQADKALATCGVSRTWRSRIDRDRRLTGDPKEPSKPKPLFKRGDLFEIILIQIKGGGSETAE